jgi:glycosyltransferase involved in cell wall biosynthesis
MQFDQYQRYHTASSLINKVRKPEERFRILEVGANVHANLAYFLTEDELVFLDQSFDSDNLDQRFVLGDATKMQFQDNAFDYIISLDVLEHIPDSKRSVFFNELVRVSKYGLLLSFPYKSQAVEEAEKAVNQYNIDLFGVDHPWLKEHIDNGLPNIDDILELPALEGLDKAYFLHGNIDVWTELTKAGLSCERLTKYEADFSAPNDLYNRFLCDSDIDGNGYRCFFVASKANVDKSSLASEVKSYAFPKEAVTINYREVISESEKYFNSLVNAELGGSVAALPSVAHSMIYTLKKILMSQADAVDTIDNELHDTRSQLSDLIESYDELLLQQKKLDADLLEVYTSTTWKIAAPIRKVSRILTRVRNARLLLSFARKSGQKIVREVFAELSSGGVPQLKNWFRDLSDLNTEQMTPAERPDIKLGEYDRWVLECDTINFEQLAAYRLQINSFDFKPLVSIVVPVYNCPEVYLRRMIDSVRDQVYQKWELCIADDASPAPHVKIVLDEYQALDDRIKVNYRKDNGHISAATNSALEIATGDYIALLDHDDELREHALYWVVSTLNEQPDIQFIYSDEDKIDGNGRRFQPHFKPDWSPELFYAQNYLCHFSVIKASLIDSVGPYRIGFEGAQDFELFLRCTADLAANQIFHIPKILYHWRAIEGSTALSLDEKSYAHEAGVKSLTEFAERKYPGAKVEGGLFPTTYRLTHPIKGLPKVALIIPTKNMKTLLEQCINSILSKTNYSNYEIVVVNNQSTDIEALNYLSKLALHSKITVLEYDKPFNFSAMNNYAVSQIDADVIGLVNNDIEVISPHWLDEMLALVCLDEVGCVGAKLYYSDDTVQHGGAILWRCGVAEHLHKGFAREHPGYYARLTVPLNVSAVTAACLLVKKADYDAVGGLDEDNLTVAYNDIDFCLKLAMLGKRNAWTPYAELYHHESASRGADESDEKLARLEKESSFMYEKWAKVLPEDGYYNPNLSLENLDITLAFPPRSYK